MQASQEGRVDVVNVLLDHGANANHQTDVSLTFCLIVSSLTLMGGIHELYRLLRS